MWPPFGWGFDVKHEEERAMRQVVMHGPGDVQVEDREDPKILAPTDAIIRLSATCICGSDLWPYRGAEPVDHQVMGHEYVEMKNSHAAIEAYRRAVDVNRKDYRAWYGLGQAYELLNMHQYALHYYRKNSRVPEGQR